MFLFPHAKILAPVLRATSRDFFAEDLKFISYLGEAMDVRQAKVDVLDFKDTDRKQWRFLHSGLRLRVCHRKARKMAFELLGLADCNEWTPLMGKETL